MYFDIEYDDGQWTSVTVTTLSGEKIKLYRNRGINHDFGDITYMGYDFQVLDGILDMVFVNVGTKLEPKFISLTEVVKEAEDHLPNHSIRGE